jgi:hypothetical protein
MKLIIHLHIIQSSRMYETSHVLHVAFCMVLRYSGMFSLAQLFIIHNVCFIRDFSGWVFLLLATYCAWRLETCTVGNNDRFHSRYVVLVQLILLPTAIWNIDSTAKSIRDKQGLLQVNQIVSWSLLGEFTNCMLKLSHSGSLFPLYPN